MSEGEPGGWFTGVVHRRSLEGGAVVNSERTEAMDGRGERPVGQLPGSPERHHHICTPRTYPAILRQHSQLNSHEHPKRPA